MSNRQVPIVIITGYLGSGKTTLMQNILRQEERKVALIVNDMGAVNIDADLLHQTDNQLLQAEMVEMQNGCICCTLRDEFMGELERISKDTSIEAVFVEASGISEPSAIAGAFVNYEEMTPDTRLYLKKVVSVVDVDRIYREFLHQLSSGDQGEDGDIINLIMDQIEFCNLMILNKKDLLNEDQLEEVKVGLRQIQQEAQMVLADHSQVDLDLILGGEDFDFEEVEAYSSVQKALNQCEHEDEKACVDEYGISSFVFEENRPFNRQAFNHLLEEYPESLIRSKGYIWFSDDWEHVQLFEQAGRNASITELSPWIAAWPKEELEAVIKDYPDITDDWDSHYGDRCNQVVFIGKDYEKKEILDLLYECVE